MRILLVDDDEYFCDIIQESLKKRGLSDITRVESAEQALEVVNMQTTPFDVYLLDIILGDMDGIELCQHLRRRADCKAAPIIMITGSQKTKLMQDAFEAGATDFLRKPLDHIELAGRINTAMLLVTAANKEKRRRDALLAGAASVPGFDTLQASERVCFSDVTGVMDYYQLENRLHLLKDGVHWLSLFRIHIVGFESHCLNTDRLVSLKCLRSVSEELSNAMASRDFCLSYIGYGRFICCILGRSEKSPELVENELRASSSKALKRMSTLTSDDLSTTVSSLSKFYIMPKTTAITLVRQEYQNDQVSNTVMTNRCDVDVSTDNIFSEMSF